MSCDYCDKESGFVSEMVNVWIPQKIMNKNVEVRFEFCDVNCLSGWCLSGFKKKEMSK